MVIRVGRHPLHEGRDADNLGLNSRELGLGNGSGFLDDLPVPLCRGKLGLESIGFALQLGLPLLEAGLLKPQLPAILRDKGLGNLCHLLVILQQDLRLPGSKGLVVLIT